ISEAVAAGLLNQRCTAAASPGWKRRRLTSGRSLTAQTLRPARAGGPGRGRPRGRSVGSEALAAEDELDGAGEDAGVEAGRAVLDVPDVELDPRLPGDPGAALDLGPAGDPGADLVAPPLPRRVVVDLGRDRRARADDRHLAAQDVDQVRDLVE